MAYISLDDIMDGIDGYNKTLAQFGFKAAGTGTLAWSHRYENARGDVMEFNQQGWDLFRGGVCNSGRSHVDFKATLLEDCSKEELIRLLTA